MKNWTKFLLLLTLSSALIGCGNRTNDNDVNTFGDGFTYRGSNPVQYGAGDIVPVTECPIRTTNLNACLTEYSMNDTPFENYGVKICGIIVSQRQGVNVIVYGEDMSELAVLLPGDRNLAGLAYDFRYAKQFERPVYNSGNNNGLNGPTILGGRLPACVYGNKEPQVSVYGNNFTGFWQAFSRVFPDLGAKFHGIKANVVPRTFTVAGAHVDV